MATKRDEAEDASSADDACALTPSEGAGDRSIDRLKQ